jgi:short-subunit dehydrogenase
MKQTIWITGATAGIGKALALQYAAHGATLILSARRKDVLKTVADECEQLGAPSAHYYVMDMEKPAQIEEVALRVLAEHPEINILVNNAGISQRSLVRDTEMDVYRRIMEIDFMAQIHLTKLLLPHFRSLPYSKIVVISSLTGKFSTPLRSGYAAAKHALHGFFDALRIEERDQKVCITMVCPGYIRTDVSINAVQGDGSRHNKMDENQAEGMDPATLARKIHEAVEDNKKEVYFGGKETTGVWLKRFFPNFLTNYLYKSFSDELKA